MLKGLKTHHNSKSNKTSFMFQKGCMAKTCTKQNLRYIVLKHLKLVHKASSSGNTWFKTTNEVYKTFKWEKTKWFACYAKQGDLKLNF